MPSSEDFFLNSTRKRGCLSTKALSAPSLPYKSGFFWEVGSPKTGAPLDGFCKIRVVIVRPEMRLVAGRVTSTSKGVIDKRMRSVNAVS